jgi:hypothetical protein
MDRAFADAIILVALGRDPERVSDVIADVARSLIESGRYSDEEVNAAIEHWMDTASGVTEAKSAASSP